jgi:hypothetical protein
VGLLKSKGRVETAKDKVRPLAESAVGNARERVSPYAEKAVERGAAVAHAAVEKAGPVIDDALSKVGPATEHAAEKARERFNDDLMPKVTAALATLAAAAEPVIEESSRRGKATAAALKGEIDVPKKSHKLRKVVLFLGFGALAAAAVKKLLTPPEPAWQSTPTSGRDYSSAPAGTTSRPAADKPAGTAPTAESSNGQTEDEKTETKSEPTSGAAGAKSDDAPKKGRKLRRVVLFLGFGALAAAAVKKLLTPPEPAWQSTPTSGRDYSSAPTGTTSARPADKPATAAAPKAETKTDSPSANGKTEEDDTKAEAKPDEAAANASSNGTAKKTTTRRSTGSSDTKPTES